jgi:hypothetical protein
MIKISRCGERFLLLNDLRSVRIHLSKKELVSVVRSGIKALAAKRRAKACGYCHHGGCD